MRPRLGSTSLGRASLIAAMVLVSACAHVVKHQAVPEHRLAARLSDFDVGKGAVVLHYYGSGGWGIGWRKQYVLLAPYFSNHGFAQILFNLPVQPRSERIEAGFEQTPVDKTSLILVGHGHIDHAADIPGYFAPGLIPKGQADLVADRTVTNILAADAADFRYVCPIDVAGYGSPVTTACVDKNFFRVVPLHSAHAAHVRFFGVDAAAFDGAVLTPMLHEPTRPNDFQLGYPVAFVIDLLDENGKTAFRIHYMDAAAGPPHALLPPSLSGTRRVDVHIGCVPGYDFVSEYPEAVIDSTKARYAMAAHWENFFRDPEFPLEPVPFILDDDKIDRFVDRLERALDATQSDAPPPKMLCGDQPCGPHGARWALPIPGETFQFSAGDT